MKITAAWLANDTTQRVLSLLVEAGYQAFVVGGCVRNALLMTSVSDIDVTTDARPDVVSDLAQAAGIKVIPTGIDHGTVTLVTGGVPYEVTTFRRDVATDGRRATVAFADTMEEDARRRDFTVNALYADAGGGVHDPLGGLPDIAAKRIRFVGDAEARIREDALRMLRFFRFHAWYGDPMGGMDEDAIAAIAEHGDLADGLSRERVGAEMRKLLGAPDPVFALSSMAATGLLARLLPGANPGALGPLLAVEPGADWQRRLAALGGQDAVERLRLSRVEAARLEATRAVLEEGSAPAVAAYRHGAEVARDAALIGASVGGAVPGGLEVAIARGAAAVFPVRAADIADRFEPGPAMGRELKRLKAVWIASDFALSREELLGD